MCQLFWGKRSYIWFKVILILAKLIPNGPRDVKISLIWWLAHLTDAQVRTWVAILIPYFFISHGQPAIRSVASVSVLFSSISVLFIFPATISVQAFIPIIPCLDFPASVSRPTLEMTSLRNAATSPFSKCKPGLVNISAFPLVETFQMLHSSCRIGYEWTLTK